MESQGGSGAEHLSLEAREGSTGTREAHGYAARTPCRACTTKSLSMDYFTYFIDLGNRPDIRQRRASRPTPLATVSYARCDEPSRYSAFASRAQHGVGRGPRFGVGSACVAETAWRRAPCGRTRCVRHPGVRMREVPGVVVLVRGHPLPRHRHIAAGAPVRRQPAPLALNPHSAR